MSHVAATGFVRRGNERDEAQDVVTIGPIVLAAPTSRPVRHVVPAEDPLFVAVLDGMGGHSSGRLAAALAAVDLVGRTFDNKVGEHLHLEQWVTSTAHSLVTVATRLGTVDMGTTIAGVYLDGHGLILGTNVGDTRILRARGRYLCQYSVDDVTDVSVVGAPLTQCLGGGLASITPHIATLGALDGLQLLLCSDGLYRNAPLSAIEEAIASSSPAEALAFLCEGAADDASFVLLEHVPSGELDERRQGIGAAGRLPNAKET